MQEKESLISIPRNLNKPDIILHSPVQLNWKQVGFIGFGITGSILAYHSHLDTSLKIILIISSFGVSIFTSLFKYEGTSLDELSTDAVVYCQRNLYYKNMAKKGDIVVNIGSKEKESSGSSFTVPVS